MATAGAYRHLVNLERPVPGGFGQAPVWHAYKNGVWCSLRPLSAGEQMRAMQLSSFITHRVRLRYFSGLLATHRLRLVAGPVDDDGTDRVLVIKSLRDLGERRAEYELLCEEVTVGIETIPPTGESVELLSPDGSALHSPDGSPLILLAD